MTTEFHADTPTQRCALLTHTHTHTLSTLGTEFHIFGGFCSSVCVCVGFILSSSLFSIIILCSTCKLFLNNFWVPRPAHMTPTLGQKGNGADKSFVAAAKAEKMRRYTICSRAELYEAGCRCRQREEEEEEEAKGNESCQCECLCAFALYVSVRVFSCVRAWGSAYLHCVNFVPSDGAGDRDKRRETEGTGHTRTGGTLFLLCRPQVGKTI